jgi:hypothetical protein
MGKRVNLAVALGWHRPQVTARFAWLIVERGSEDGKIKCDPWQLAQFATTVEPSLEANP